MAYSHTLDLVAGDNNPKITLTIRDMNEAADGARLDPDSPATWRPIDLTGGSVRLLIREVGQDQLKDQLSGIITNGLGGVVTFILNDETFDGAGVYEGEAEVTDAQGRIQTVYDLIRFRVRAQF
jgi:hypothetical protein